ncbi:prenyltransferase/squalene oxidase repeat-containing protein [Flindersiella endophytica]
MGIAIARTARSAKSARAAISVRLILLTNRRRFVLQLDGTRFSFLRLSIDGNDLRSDSFSRSLEACVDARLGLSITYLGLLDFRVDGPGLEVVVVATVSERAAFPDAMALTIEEVEMYAMPVDGAEYLEAAYEWAIAAGAIRLGQTVQDAFGRSLDYLGRGMVSEDGIHGWNQYRDDDGLGVLSTAQGLLCYVYAHRNGVSHLVAETLTRFQNEDGGWQVRRALEGGSSQISVTESTCFCLRALHEAGRSEADPAIAAGIDWLEASQDASGGWRSSARSGEPCVSATSAAVQVLVEYGGTRAVAKAVAWLKRAQCDNGGWARETASSSDMATPAYTAHAIVALLAAGVPKDDGVIVRGCDYLIGAFDRSRSEPWASTYYRSIVDPSRSARMTFRLFATPWVLAALILAGRDLDDPRILLGVERLLALQESNGAWRTDAQEPDRRSIWAVHDALFALRTFVDASGRLAIHGIVAAHQTTERRHLERLFVHAVGEGARAGPIRRRAHTAWLAILTGAVTSMAVVQFGILDLVSSFSWVQRSMAAVIVAAVSIGGVVLPAVIIEEYKIRRSRKCDKM